MSKPLTRSAQYDTDIALTAYPGEVVQVHTLPFTYDILLGVIANGRRSFVTLTAYDAQRLRYALELAEACDQ